MKTKKNIIIAACFVILVQLLFTIYHVKKEKYHIMFEGVILSIDESSLEIQGDTQNDAGFRGQYIIKENDSISINNSSGDNISFSSLDIGNHVEIHYSDYIVKSKVEQYGLNDGAEIPDVQQINIIE